MSLGAIGPYQILRELGRGGMGEVYLARDQRLDRQVAIKALPAQLSGDGERLARFQREARVLAALNHPHIGAIYGLEESDGRQFLILELIEGQTLAARIAAEAIPVAEALSIATQIAAALEAAHAKSIVHRDLKPGNVMITPQGAVKVLDFGLARSGDESPKAPGSAGAPPPTDLVGPDSPTIHGAILGTAGYMSPEQARGEAADARSDVFSFGCVLYELLTGRRSFAGGTAAETLAATLHGEVDLSLLPAGTPSQVRAVLNRCLSREPSARFASGAELGAALEAMRRWARDQGIPRLTAICERILVMEESRDSWSAFELAGEIDKLAPGDPLVERLRPEFALPISIETTPPGARVFAAFYGDPEGVEIDLGRTPLRSIPFPRGLARLRLELPGHRTVHDLLWNLHKMLNNAMDRESVTWRYAMRADGEIPDDMEEVPAGRFIVLMPGLDHMDAEPTAAFLIDRNPVTNRQYKRFVDDGGYQRREFWTEPFQAGDSALASEEAMARLVDSVGHPGPAGWEMGDYPSGMDDHPVTGVSWYEAMAYAAWAGKRLPTVFHWSRVAFTHGSGLIAPAANFSGRGTVPVGSTRSVNRFGVRDMAGNVREWIANPIDRPGSRFILGGGWNDPNYAFVDGYAQPAFDRSPANGIRCMRELETETNRERLNRSIPVGFRDFRAEKPAPDEVFAYFRRQFQYDRTPLREIVVTESPLPQGHWQAIEIAAAYGGERMRVHLFLPARGRPPYQTVMLFPGSAALHMRVYSPMEISRVDFLLKSGRAVVLPTYKSTYERGDEIRSDYPDQTAAYRDHVVMWGKDLGRAIDLVESRSDLDATRIAYYGVSWGGALGAILPAIEPRIKVNVLYVAGLAFQRALPEADQINYITRVTQPTLMLNGELDFFFPLEHSQRPMFELLGTPPEHKRQLTYERGHTVPKTELIRQSLAWLDRYLGPVGDPAIRD